MEALRVGGGGTRPPGMGGATAGARPLTSCRPLRRAVARAEAGLGSWIRIAGKRPFLSLRSEWGVYW